MALAGGAAPPGPSVASRALGGSTLAVLIHSLIRRKTPKGLRVPDIVSISGEGKTRLRLC